VMFLFPFSFFSLIVLGNLGFLLALFFDVFVSLFFLLTLCSRWLESWYRTWISN
jgi:hypothetical protein